MNGNVRLRLSVMMFLQYAFNGIVFFGILVRDNTVVGSGKDGAPGAS